MFVAETTFRFPLRCAVQCSGDQTRRGGGHTDREPSGQGQLLAFQHPRERGGGGQEHQSETGQGLMRDKCKGNKSLSYVILPLSI